ncbi:MAG: transglutaminase domain-containing protein [Planctomycetes bacterium]|nr:transglutaminase domain-containing protein [Planctomycetota bacterium]
MAPDMIAPDTSPSTPPLTRHVTLALLLLASSATEIAAVETRPLPISVGLAALWVGLAALGARFAPTPARTRRLPYLALLFVVIVLSAAPFLVEPLRRSWFGVGYPLELQLVFALRNLGLGFVVFASWPSCVRLAGVASLFLMLFSVTIAAHPVVRIFLGIYCALGSIWLMLVYWTGLRRYFVASDATVKLEIQGGPERWPWLATCVVVGAVAAILALVAVGPERVARIAWEWLPTSGGTGAFDPYARGGVNDGDDETKGNDPRSTGMTQTDMFLESPLPSLYDVINDLYGEPFKPKERAPALPLDIRSKANESQKPPADNLRPNREFPTTRKSPSAPREPGDRKARALFEVQGRTPLHVRVVAFDTFDGVSWREAPVNMTSCLFIAEPVGHWIQLRDTRPDAIFAATEAHQFKITGSNGALLPTPPHLARFRVGRVDKTEFFCWGQDRIILMARRETPTGIVVETESQLVDANLLICAGFSVPREGILFAGLPNNLNPKIAALAQEWADPYPRGWPQIAAIQERLRADLVLDWTARVPDDCGDPLGHFLFDSGRGPDYQFATAAAVLLRSLGYTTRLVSGFYVAPENYDPQSRHTPVVHEDLHFWAEVRLPSGDWLIVEPTPGYDVLQPGPSIFARVWESILDCLVWASGHAIELTLGLVAVGSLLWWRREFLEAAARTFLRVFPGPNWQACVRRVLWLLEWRGGWAGRPRRSCQTFPAWIRGALAMSIAPNSEIDQLLLMADWAAYANDLAPPWSATHVRDICGQVVDRWPLSRWRNETRGKPGA